MDVAVLGPLCIEEQGASIVPSASKPRQVLALLALHADRVVTVPTLVEELWGAEPPRSAATTLQTYVLQLRRLISAALASSPGREAKDVLVTRHGGYLLEARPGRLDAEEFQQLAGAGRQAYEAGDDRSASDLLGKSLALWRGPALLDVRAGRVLELDVLDLEEARMAAHERRIAADLRLGRHGALIGELRVLVARYPMHENFCIQLMLAFYRCGNSWRALEAFHALRNTLNRELGIEPSNRVHRLQQAILRGDPGLDLDSAREASYDRRVA